MEKLTIAKKFPKYITIARHQEALHGKLWSYIALDSTNRQMAIAEGSRKGFKIDEPFCVHIAKRINQRGRTMYKSILRVFRSGLVQDTSTVPYCNWFVEYSDINFAQRRITNKFEKQVQDVLSVLRDGQGVLADKGVVIDIDDKRFPSIKAIFFKDGCRIGWLETYNDEQFCSIALDGISELAKAFEMEEIPELMRGWIENQ